MTLSDPSVLPTTISYAADSTFVSGDDYLAPEESFLSERSTVYPLFKKNSPLSVPVSINQRGTLTFWIYIHTYNPGADQFELKIHTSNSQSADVWMSLKMLA